MGIVLFGLVLVLEVGNVLIYNYINFYINEVYLLFYIVINFFFSDGFFDVVFYINSCSCFCYIYIDSKIYYFLFYG